MLHHLYKLSVFSDEICTFDGLKIAAPAERPSLVNYFLVI